MKWLLIFLSLMLLGACKDDSAGAGMPKQFEPVVNPHPKYFFTVKGQISKKLMMNKKTNIVWNLIYQTNSLRCRKSVNRLEGVYDSRYITKNVVITPNAKGIYSSKIAINQFFPGECKWAISEINYSVANLKNIQVAFFGKQERNNTYIAKNDIACDVQNDGSIKCHYFKPFETFNNHTLKVSRNANYVFILNIL